jgi:hypothetical protein
VVANVNLATQTKREVVTRLSTKNTMTSRVADALTINARRDLNIPIRDKSKSSPEVMKFLTFTICFSLKLRNHGHLRELI